MVVYISQGADHEELLKISGDESRTFNVDDFTMLDTVKDAISKETCKASGIDKLCFSFQFFCDWHFNIVHQKILWDGTNKRLFKDTWPLRLEINMVRDIRLRFALYFNI